MVSYLRHVISAAGVKMDHQKVAAIEDCPTPASVCAVRSFLGLAGYYRRFIKDYGAITTPLTRFKKAAFDWSEEASQAF